MAKSYRQKHSNYIQIETIHPQSYRQLVHKGIKIPGRYNSSWNSAPFFLKSSGPLNCTFICKFCWVGTLCGTKCKIGELSKYCSHHRYIYIDAVTPTYDFKWYWLNVSVVITGSSMKIYKQLFFFAYDKLIFAQVPPICWMTRTPGYQTVANVRIPPALV